MDELERWSSGETGERVPFWEASLGTSARPTVGDGCGSCLVEDAYLFFFAVPSMTVFHVVPSCETSNLYV